MPLKGLCRWVIFWVLPNIILKVEVIQLLPPNDFNIEFGHNSPKSAAISIAGPHIY